MDKPLPHQDTVLVERNTWPLVPLSSESEWRYPPRSPFWRIPPNNQYLYVSDEIRERNKPIIRDIVFEATPSARESAIDLTAFADPYHGAGPFPPEYYFRKDLPYKNVPIVYYEVDPARGDEAIEAILALKKLPPTEG